MRVVALVLLLLQSPHPNLLPREKGFSTISRLSKYHSYVSLYFNDVLQTLEGYIDVVLSTSVTMMPMNIIPVSAINMEIVLDLRFKGRISP